MHSIIPPEQAHLFVMPDRDPPAFALLIDTPDETITHHQVEMWKIDDNGLLWVDTPQHQFVYREWSSVQTFDGLGEQE